MTSRSTMVIRPLPGGLEYFAHTLPAISESSPAGVETAIDVAGTATVLYRNTRLAQMMRGFVEPLLAQTVEVTGNPFGAPAAWSMRYSDSRRVSMEESCTPGRTVAASTIHPSLTGDATLYACVTPGDASVREIRWYVPALQRYIQYESWIDDEKESQVRVVGVRFR